MWSFLVSVKHLIGAPETTFREMGSSSWARKNSSLYGGGQGLNSMYLTAKSYGEEYVPRSLSLKHHLPRLRVLPDVPIRHGLPYFRDFKQARSAVKKIFYLHSTASYPCSVSFSFTFSRKLLHLNSLNLIISYTMLQLFS